MAALSHATKRLIPLYVIWCLLYFLLPMLLFPNNIEQWLHGDPNQFFNNYWDKFANKYHKRPFNYWWVGTERHLWFLPALWIGQVLTIIGYRFLGFKGLGIVSVALYIAALLGKPYADSTLGFNWSFNMRNGPFFCMIFIFMGLCFARYEAKNWPINRAVLLLLTFAGFTAVGVEISLIKAYLGKNMMSHDFVIASIPFTAAIALLAIKSPNFGNRIKLYKLGELTLAFYLVHLMVIGFLSNFFEFRSWPGLDFFAYGYIASMFVAAVLVRTPYIKKYVM